MDLIKDKEETMFPIVSRKRRLDPTVFDYMQGQIRQLMWHYRLINTEYDAYRFVQELPLIGSVFDNTNGSYVTPGGYTITLGIREYVKLNKTRYREI